MSAEPITRPSLRFHGGKWRIAPWLISLFPPHRIYVDIAVSLDAARSTNKKNERQ
jgi:site-specific DNA-adenine methylase